MASILKKLSCFDEKYVNGIKKKKIFKSIVINCKHILV